MSALPPLGDVLALASPDEDELLAAERRIEARGAFEAVWRPAPGRLLAVAPLPKSAPEDEAAEAAGLAVAQGRDLLAGSGRDWDEVARLVAERPERLEELPGDFGLVHVGSSGVATVARSAGGLVPFYVAGGGKRWVVSTTLAHMIAFQHEEPELDPLVNAIWTSGSDAAPGRRTFLAGVRVLGRGEYARLDGGEPRFGRWWDPREGAAPHVSAEHPERLRAALLGNLDRELDRDGENLLALSGGVDSSSVGALAAGLLGREVSTLTMLPTNEAARARDLGYVEELARAVTFKRRRTVTVDSEVRLGLFDETQVPFHVPQPYLALLRPLRGEWDFSVYVTGELADQTVGSAATRHDWARHTSLRGLSRRDARDWFAHRLRRAIRRPTVPWPRELPELVRPELRAEYAEWFGERRGRAARDSGPMPYLTMLLEHEGSLGMHWEMTSDLGVRPCFPFVSRDVLELAFECHPAELVGAGTKRLLRTALAGDVPERNLQRPDKGRAPAEPGQGPRRWRGEIPAVLEPVLAPGWPPDREIDYWDVFRMKQLVSFAEAFERATRCRSR